MRRLAFKLPESAELRKPRVLLEDGAVGSMTHLWLLAALPGMFMVGEIRRDSAALEQTSGAAPLPRGEAGERRGAVVARWHPPGPRPVTVRLSGIPSPC